MIQHALDTEGGILYVRPTSTLEEGDFTRLAESVDPYIEEHGDLAGIIVDAPEFPGWEDFRAMMGHLRFVRNHHRRIRKVGLVTDSALGNVAEAFASHFVSAEVRHFPAGDLESARRWVTDRS